MMSDEGTIVVFAKCPMPGKSKTRLSGLLGLDGSAFLAKAMLSDVLKSISEDERLSGCAKVLVYAPGTREGNFQMTAVLVELGLAHTSPEAYDSTSQWILLPMASILTVETGCSPERQTNTGNEETNNKPSELLSSDLGSKLADALRRVRKITPDNPVVILGMDSPELLIDEVIDAMQIASKEMGKAYINPAHDGGYGMLCVPSEAPLDIFSGVRWSSPLTAVSQMKALSDNGIDTIVGSLMNDIDEPDDVMNLAIRLCRLYTNGRNNESNYDPRLDRLCHGSEICINAENESDSLNQTSQFVQNRAMCSQTFEALLELGLIERKEREGRTFYKAVISKG